MVVPDVVLRLVDQFDKNRDQYLSPSYNEAQLRQEFLNPFFSALGWDMENKAGAAQPYKEVIHEDSIKIGGETKAPDYGFRVGRDRKFFVEAKKPAVNIREDLTPAFQLRRYAWTAKLPLSILTDFQEFAVYDCRSEPSKTDKATTARIKYLGYQDYALKWDEISSVFSRDAVWQGSFDKYVLDTRSKKGADEVDDAFLKDIESWRDILARNIALRNPKLTVHELNFAVQRTIDRIIFLRICEDRGVEIYGTLRALVNGERTYKRMQEVFHRADEKYNSGLFHFTAEKGRAEGIDELTLNLTIDDKPLKEIIGGLYYPDCPYEFSVFPADILGQVYEQFLGKVIRLTAGHQAKVEEKPEVKKAGGVYYTPTYIVDYIVKNTIGKLVEGKTPRQVSAFRILDPACGSGSFLIGAYQYLLDWHQDWYAKEGPEKWSTGKKAALYRGPGGEWRLTTTERKSILLNNIYGVDIDEQAVEVTKLSLLLKVLEGESDQSISQQLKMFHERALPDLGDNIKCGNSLIGSDFFDGELVLDQEERSRTNAFDWKIEFKEIMDGGGFDAVIGNPPYLRIQGLQEHYGTQLEYFERQYQSAVKRYDLYLLFIEKGTSLLRNKGVLGFICPHKFVNSDFGSGLRMILTQRKCLLRLLSFGNNLVFRDASTYTGLLFIQNARNDSFEYYEFPDTPEAQLPIALVKLQKDDTIHIPIASLSEDPWVLGGKEFNIILNRISVCSRRVGDVTDEILVGVQSGVDAIHILKDTGKRQRETRLLFSERAGSEVAIEDELVKPFLMGDDVHRYEEPRPTYYCIYPYRLVKDKTTIYEEAELRTKFPKGYAYLNEYRRELQTVRKRQKTNEAYWYSCHRSRDMAVFESDRILTPYASLGCNMTLGSSGIYHNTKVYSIVPSTKQNEHTFYFLGILNSRLLWHYMANTGYVLRGGYYTFTTDYLSPFPFREIDVAKESDKSLHDSVVQKVEMMLKLHVSLSVSKIDHEQTAIKRQIDATDKQIDALVYELYGLTEEEIRLVEGEKLAST